MERTQERAAEVELPSTTATSEALELPGILLGHESPAVRARVQRFYLSVHAMFDAWVNRSANKNTQRTYRRAVENFIEFLDIDWSREAHQLFAVSVEQVQDWRDFMIGDPDDPSNGQAPSTVNGRISALSHFYNFMRETASSKLKLPIDVPNPAHAQFIKREKPRPRTPTRALSLTLAHKLLSLPQGDTVLVSRDRAILSVFLYVGVRIGTACRLAVTDFHDDPDDPTLDITEKGKDGSKRTVGIKIHCAEAIRAYVEEAKITSGPLFRARAGSRSQKLGSTAISQRAMYRLLIAYLKKLPRAATPDGGCRYSPHSLRATTATVLDEAGVQIKKIQELLGHADIRVTQGYIKLLNNTKRSASHDVPL